MAQSDEVRLPRRPSFGRLESTRLQRLFAHGDIWFGRRFTRRLAETLRLLDARVVQAIPHGPEFWYAYQAARETGAKYALYVHDDLPYNLPGVPYLPWAMEKLGEAWRNADVRFVISEPMGRGFNARYGERPYHVVTDGLESLPDGPRRRPAGRLRVYLMGSIHLSYERNFRDLFAALASVRDARPDLEVSLVLRGGFPFPVDTRGIPVELRPWGSQQDIERDLDDADVLYLPLPFDVRHESFVRYSLATKLVTYLGAGLPILYHGPAYAAAAQVLATRGAAALATSEDGTDLIPALQHAQSAGEDVAAAALGVARDHFMIDDLAQVYWGEIESLTGVTSRPASTRSIEVGVQ